MKIFYGNQTIDLFSDQEFPNGPPERVVTCLSGGCDSASLIYLIAKNFPETEIIPFHARDVQFLADTENAYAVCEYLQKKFPNVKIHDLETYDIDMYDPDWREKAEEARNLPSGKVLVNGKLEYKWRTLTATAIALQNRKIREDIAEKYKTIVIGGMNCNPPVDTMKELGFYDVSERKRDPGVVSDKILDGHEYSPLLYVDKKFVAGVFRENNLMDLFYLTKSCGWGVNDGNENYPEPCGKCFWCHERKWAFDLEKFE